MNILKFVTEKFQDLRQTREYSKYIDDLGWCVDEFQGVFIYVKKFLFWKFVKVQRPGNFNVDILNSYLHKKYRFSTVYIEPNDESQEHKLLKVGFKKYNSPFLSSKTVKIDLTKTEKDLLSEMHPKTRYNIKKNSKNRFKVIHTSDIQKFTTFWQFCARQRGMFLDQRKEIELLYNAFSKNSDISIAVDNKNNWLSGLFRVSTDNISYYMYAASSKEGKKHFAPTILAWEAIKSAKVEEKKVFDFEGIFDERFPLNSWKGFTRFKKSFGGREVEYPGILKKVVF